MTATAQQIEEARKRWQAEHFSAKHLDVATTDSGLDVDILYTPANLEQTDYLQAIGFPGEYPFTRGVYASMYRGRLWTMRQYAGFGTAEESNARYKLLLSQGQTGLSVAFDLPTQLGYDSDNPLARQDVGRVGVAVDTVRDVEALFDGIALDRVSTNLTINSPAAILLAMYLVVGEKQGIAIEELRGTVQNDILKEYLARKTYIFPPQPSLRLTADVIAFCSERMPYFNPISITGYHTREAGANAIQEGAYTMSAAIAYTREVLARGIDVDSFARQLSFHFSTSRDFFEEIAKIRACRRLWARIMRDTFGAKDPNSLKMRFFNGGNGSWLTAREPLNNIVRATLQCLAGVLAGAQACHVPAYDEAYAIPSEDSARLSLRTQQIVAYESGVTRTVDPLGGSFYVESLTDRIEEKIKQLIDQIDDQGGLIASIERGEPQREILAQAYETQKRVSTGQSVIVGVNVFADEGEAQPIELQEPDPSVAERQIVRLNQIRAQRDDEAVQQALARLRSAAASEENIMPSTIAAVRACASIGEMVGAMEEVFGRYKEPADV